MRGLPLDVLHLIATQHHLVTWHQLIVDGYPATTVKRWVRDGLLVRVHRGVFRLNGTAPSREQTLMAAALRAGPEARAGGPSACWLYGLDGVDPDWPPWILVPPARVIRGVPFTVVRSGWAATDERTVRGVPTVAPGLALIDYAGVVTPRRTRVAIDSARRAGLVRTDRLVEQAAGLGRRPGAHQVRRLYDLGQLRQESEGERRLARLFRPGDPQPLWGVWVYEDVRVDAIFLAARLVLEYDGRDHHTIDTDRDHDSRRELRLKQDLIEVIRITHGMLRDEPEQTRRRVLRIYHQRMAFGLPPVIPARRVTV